jgi:hypothetical protein
VSRVRLLQFGCKDFRTTYRYSARLAPGGGSRALKLTTIRSDLLRHHEIEYTVLPSATCGALGCELEYKTRVHLKLLPPGPFKHAVYKVIARDVSRHLETISGVVERCASPGAADAADLHALLRRSRLFGPLLGTGTCAFREAWRGPPRLLGALRWWLGLTVLVHARALWRGWRDASCYLRPSCASSCSTCRKHRARASATASASLQQQLARGVAGGVEAAAGMFKGLVSDSCYRMGGHVAAAEL